MDFTDRLDSLAENVRSYAAGAWTIQEAKNVFVVPFIRFLGYNVDQPLEVMPDYGADNHRVAFAIKRAGEPTILVDVVPLEVEVCRTNSKSLHQVFSRSPARFAILTNGLHWSFYSDLECAGQMDRNPFLEFSLCETSRPDLRSLECFCKSSFTTEGALKVALVLRYTSTMREVLDEQLGQADGELVLFILRRVYKGRVSNALRAQFRHLTREAFRQFAKEHVETGLQPTQQSESEEDSVTAEERQAFEVVQSIVGNLVDLDRLSLRARRHYSNVLLDDNARRHICRFWFTTPTKVVSVRNPAGKDVRYTIGSVQEIEGLANIIRPRLREFLSPTA